MKNRPPENTGESRPNTQENLIKWVNKSIKVLLPVLALSGKPAEAGTYMPERTLIPDQRYHEIIIDRPKPPETVPEITKREIMQEAELAIMDKSMRALTPALLQPSIMEHLYDNQKWEEALATVTDIFKNFDQYYFEKVTTEEVTEENPIPTEEWKIYKKLGESPYVILENYGTETGFKKIGDYEMPSTAMTLPSADYERFSQDLWSMANNIMQIRTGGNDFLPIENFEKKAELWNIVLPNAIIRLIEARGPVNAWEAKLLEDLKKQMAKQPQDIKKVMNGEQDFTMMAGRVTGLSPENIIDFIDIKGDVNNWEFFGAFHRDGFARGHIGDNYYLKNPLTESFFKDQYRCRQKLAGGKNCVK